MRRVGSDPRIEHTFFWTVLLERMPRGDEEIYLFKQGAMHPSAFWPPHVDMKIYGRDAFFDRTMHILGMAASRPDVVLEAVIGLARTVVLAGPWITEPRQSVLGIPLVVPVRQSVAARVTPLPGATGPCHIWWRVLFSGEPSAPPLPQEMTP